MSLCRRCGGIGTDLFNSASKALRSSAVLHRAALHTPAKKLPYPVSVDTSRILHSSKPIPVRTLFHRWFTPEDYFDLSDARGVIVGPGDTEADLALDGVDEATVPYITYWRKSELRQDQGYRQVTYFPFPVNARGFLYFWQHPTMPIASGIRFRVSQGSNIPGFIQGRDLQTPYGTPWHIPLLALATSPRYAALQDVLQQDGYVPPQLLEHCAQLKRLDALGQWSQLVFLRGQPFYLDLGVPRSKIFLAGMNGIRGIYLDEDLFCEMPYPFKSGVILCRFETRPNHVGIRVMRIIEPVQFIDGYEGMTDKLQPGQLVTLRGRPQLFLSQKDRRGVELNKRWQYISKKNTFAWSWHELRHVAGKDWTFPWDLKNSKKWAAARV